MHDKPILPRKAILVHNITETNTALLQELMKMRNFIDEEITCIQTHPVSIARGGEFGTHSVLITDLYLLRLEKMDHSLE